jgi:hypothetical protein
MWSKDMKRESFIIHTSLLLLFSLLPISLWAKPTTIQGEIINGTTGKPAQVEEVRLIQLKEGMKVLAIQRDLKGSYKFEETQLEASVPHLIQVSYQGVIYSTPLLLEQLGEKPLQTTVYDTTQSWENLTIPRALLILLKEKNILKVQKVFVIKNESQTPKTYTHFEETFRFYIPPEAKESRSVTVSSGMMPLRQTMTSIENSNFFAIQYPIKPGQTQVMIQYELDYKNSEISMNEELSYDIEELDVLVHPTDMQVKIRQISPSTKSENGSEGHLFENKGIHPEMGLLLLQGKTFKKGQQIELQVSGGTDIEEAKVIDAPNRTQNFLIPIVAGLSLILILGSLPSLKRKDLQILHDQKTKLLDELIKLNAIYKTGKMSSEEYEVQKDHLKSQLLHLMKKTTHDAS